MNPWDGSIPCHPYDAAKVVYVEVPKAGCTSIKHAMAGYKGGPPDPDEDIHHWTGYTVARDLGELHRWLDTRWREYFRFTVVRHPVDRFVSLFLGLGGADRVAAGWDIDRYVAVHFEHDQRRLDIHAVPQTMLVGTEMQRFDYVGRLEDMGDVAQQLTNATGSPVTIPHHNAAQVAHPLLMRYTVAHLAAIYRADFETFGYETDVPSAKLMAAIA